MKAKSKMYFIFLLLLLLSVSFIAKSYLMLPSQIALFQGKPYQFSLDTQLPYQTSPNEKALSSQLLIDNPSQISGSTSLELFCEKIGNYALTFRLFGLLPVRTIPVNVIPTKQLIPCGNTIGVQLFADGCLVIGTSDVLSTDGKRYQPWKEAGLRAGDVITHINDTPVSTIEELSSIVSQSKEDSVLMKVQRKNQVFTARITPKISKEDSVYRLGLWVRDSTAGIGTLTFIDPETGTFGALGHGIADIDTGVLFHVRDGKIFDANILSVQKGTRGTPGELKGVFTLENGAIGKLLQNDTSGIYGLTSIIPDTKPLPVALQNEIVEGKAYILSNIQGAHVEKFDVEVVQINHKNAENGKGLVLKITDERLLEKTGGIVQGMSGSPIIQNGKIIGAITHVFINDPTKGYGIFIENMIKQNVYQLGELSAA